MLRLVLSGDIPMGGRLNESYLATRLGISRGTLRVALRHLVNEGLAVERPRQGVFVAVFDGNDVADIYNLRAGIEGTAARLAVRSGSDLGELRVVLDAMYAAAELGDLGDTMEHEYRFHETLCTLSGNAQIAAVYRVLRAKIRIALSIDNRDNANLVDLPRRHESMLAALYSGDERAAADATVAHIVGHVGDVIARMGGDPGRLLSP